MAILAEADRGEQTIGMWRRAPAVSEPTLPQLAEAGGMGVEEARECRQLKQENARLNRELPERRDEGGDLTPQARRNYVLAMMELQTPERRSCQLLGMSQSEYRLPAGSYGSELTDLRGIASGRPAAGSGMDGAASQGPSDQPQEGACSVAGLGQPRKAPSPDGESGAGEGRAREPRLLRLHP